MRTPPRPRRRVLLTLVAATAALGLVACGGSGSASTPTPTSSATSAVSATPSPRAPATRTPTVTTTPSTSRTPGAVASPSLSKTPSASPTVAATPTPASAITFSYGPETTEGDRTLVSRGVEYASGYVEAETGQHPVQCTLFVYANLSNLVNAILQSNFPLDSAPSILAARLNVTTAESMPGAVFVATNSYAWQQFSDVERFRTAAHEYFHVVQMHLMGPLASQLAAAPSDRVGPQGPMWLFEGAAEYVGWKALEDAGLGSLEAHLKDHPLTANVGLAQLETSLTYNADQPDSAIRALSAVRLLLGSGNPTPLIDYWQRLGDGETWQDAFEHAFGMPVSAFYEQFNHWAGVQ